MKVCLFSAPQLLSKLTSHFGIALLLLCSFTLPLISEAKKVRYTDGTVIYTLDTSTGKASVTGVEEGSSSRKVNILDYILNVDDGKTYTVTSIGKEAFLGSFLKDISLPSTIETIGSHAFKTCTFKKLDLPANLKVIGAYAFCEAIYSTTPIDLVIPSGCTAIKDFAFNSCSIRSIRFNSKLTTLGQYSFAATDLTEVEIPATVSSLGNGVFAGCEKLKTATLKGNRTTLPYQFFDGCKALTTVSLPTSITSLGTWSLANCTSLKTIALPASLKTIGDMAFYKSGLSAISLPAGIQTLGDNAFAYLPSLTEIIIPASVTSIADYCFNGSTAIMNVTVLNPQPCTLGTCGFDSATYRNGTLNVPAGSESSYQYAKEWGNFRCLYDVETGIENNIVTPSHSRQSRLIQTGDKIIIEVEDGNQTLRFDLQGRRIVNFIKRGVFE